MIKSRCNRYGGGSNHTHMNGKINRRLLYAALTLGASALVLAGCSGLANSASTAGRNSQNTTPAGTQAQVTTGTVRTTIVGTGQVVARDLADVGFRTSGQIISVTVQQGDMVKTGQPLAYLDNSNLKLSVQSAYDNYINALATYSQTVEGPTALDVASAQAAVSSAEAAYSDLLKPPASTSLASLAAAVANAQDALQQAQASYDTAFKHNPAAIGASSQALALQTATNNYNEAKANYDNAFQPASSGSLASAAANIKAAEDKLAALYPVTDTIIAAKAKADAAYVAWQTANQSLSDAVIVAPYDGMVTQVAYNVGDSVNSGQTIVEVADISNPWFEVNVDESDIGNVRVGQPTIIQLQAYPTTPISGTVEFIAPNGTTSSSSVTFQVKVALGNIMANSAITPTGVSQFRQSGQGGQFQRGQGQRNPTGQGQQSNQTSQSTRTGRTSSTGNSSQFERPIVRLGMSGTGQIVTAQATNTLVIPAGALVVDRATRSYIVYKVTGTSNGKPVTQSVPVTVGIRDAGGTTVQILSGLNAGDTILVPNSAAPTTTGGGGGGRFFFGG